MAVRLVNPRKLLAPGRCLVCELQPMDNHRVVDTGRKLSNVPARHQLRGRKYICSQCGDLIAKALGYPPLSEVQKLKDALWLAEERVEELRNEINLQDRIEQLRADLAPLLPLPEAQDEVQD